MRYKLTIQYDGGGYHGWQRQKNGITVQEAMETALERIVRVPTVVYGSGRTDEGVHARGQVAHFDSERVFPPERYVAALNYWLPRDVRVTDCEIVPDTFDARKSAKRKTYVYKMYTGRTENPLRRTRELFVPRLDIPAMDEAARVFEGEHDFGAFRSSGSNAKTTVRTIYSSRVTGSPDGAEFTITGNGFLYNMVRIMAGALVRVGKGETDARYVLRALLSRDRRLVPDVAPPYALYLKNVEYPDLTTPAPPPSDEKPR